MRDLLRFRAWDTETERMYQDVTGFEGTNGVMDGIFLDGTFRSIARNEAIPMQFTGLLDKNGKEIYEGDILRSGNKAPWVMSWCQHQWTKERKVRANQILPF